MEETEEHQYEFGRGLTYCLGVFLAHAERYEASRERYTQHNMTDMGREIMLASLPMIWFNAASDHLFDIEIQNTIPRDLKVRLEEFKMKVLNWGHGCLNDTEVTHDNVIWSIREAKELLRLIDEQMLNIPTTVGYL